MARGHPPTRISGPGRFGPVLAVAVATLDGKLYGFNEHRRRISACA